MPDKFVTLYFLVLPAATLIVLLVVAFARLKQFHLAQSAALALSLPYAIGISIFSASHLRLSSLTDFAATVLTTLLVAPQAFALLAIGIFLWWTFARQGFLKSRFWTRWLVAVLTIVVIGQIYSHGILVELILDF
jgi:hypothetical protein